MVPRISRLSNRPCVTGRHKIPERRERMSQGPQAGGIVVHVAASQETSSKLCITSKPIEEKPSKFPSPSICTRQQFDLLTLDRLDLHSPAGRRYSLAV